MIKYEIIEYRNTHRESRTLLGVVLSEIAKLEKEPKRKFVEATDAECLAIIKKLVASNIECGEFEENETLNLFIPQQLSFDEIKEIMDIVKPNSIGTAMTYFKVTYPGLYDSKIVKQLYDLADKNSK